MEIIFVEYYESCGNAQCWKATECCKMKCDEDGSMLPDNQCLETNDDTAGCPLFVCERPLPNMKKRSSRKEDSIDQINMLTKFLRKLNLLKL